MLVDVYEGIARGLVEELQPIYPTVRCHPALTAKWIVALPRIGEIRLVETGMMVSTWELCGALGGTLSVGYESPDAVDRVVDFVRDLVAKTGPFWGDCSDVLGDTRRLGVRHRL